MSKLISARLLHALRVSYRLARANFSVKNGGGFTSIMWHVLDPLFLFLILLFIRDALAITRIENYPLYLLIGILTFNFVR